MEDLEGARLGVDHREAAETFARRNERPPIVLRAIAHHNEPPRAESHDLQPAATFCALAGIRPVKTFLKVVLILIAAVLAVKLLPLTLALGLALGFALVGLALAGVSIMAVLALGAVILAAVLSPIWIPLLLLVGLIALLKRLGRGRAVIA